MRSLRSPRRYAEFCVFVEDPDHAAFFAGLCGTLAKVRFTTFMSGLHNAHGSALVTLMDSGAGELWKVFNVSGVIENETGNRISH